MLLVTRFTNSPNSDPDASERNWDAEPLDLDNAYTQFVSDVSTRCVMKPN